MNTSKVIVLNSHKDIKSTLIKMDLNCGLIYDFSCDSDYSNLKSSFPGWNYSNFEVKIDNQFMKDFCESFGEAAKSFKNPLFAYCFNTINRIFTINNLQSTFINYIKLETIIEEKNYNNIIFIINDFHLFSIIKKKYGQNKKFIFRGNTFLKKGTIFFRNILSIFFHTLRILFFTFLTINIRKNIFKEKTIVIRTIFDKKMNNLTNLNDYEDYYFKNLNKYIPRIKILFIGSLFNMALIDRLKFHKKFKNTQFLTDVSFLNPYLIFKCFFITFSFKIFFNLKENKYKFRNWDITHFIRYYLINDLNSSFMTYLLEYELSKKFASKYKNMKFLYAFENRGMEKMMLFAFKKHKVKETYGYLHAPIDERHTHMYVSSSEKDIMPLPYKILTIGKVQSQDLIHNRNFPEEHIEQLGVLKQNFLFELKDYSKLNPIKKILVLLNSERPRNVFIFKFLLNYSFIGKYKVKFRFHPSYHDDSLSLEIKRSMINFEVSKNQKLIDDFDDCDLIINSGTAAACEGLYLGKPVIYIQSQDVFNDNTLKDCPGLCWSCNSYEEFSSQLQNIEEITQEDFASLFKKSKLYLEDLFEPPNEKLIEQLFLT